MLEALQKLEKIAQSNLNIVIYGEQGTGKEWAAHLVHTLSNRPPNLFVTVDCGALDHESAEKEIFGYENITWKGIELKQGAFENAGNGTLLLNDFIALSVALQVKVARALEYRSIRRILGQDEISITARTIATMTQSPDEANDGHAMRKDLYHRIGVIAIALPPIRERKGDIPRLIDYFLADLLATPGAPPKRISPEALHCCCSYSWPGNLRHLKNAIEYASIMCSDDIILPEHLPEYLLEQNIDSLSGRQIVGRK